MGLALGDALRRAGSTFLNTYKSERDRQDEQRARAFYEKMEQESLGLQKAQDAREAQAAAERSAEAAQRSTINEASIKEIADKAHAAATFFEKNHMTPEEFALLSEKEKHDAYLESQRAAAGASRMSANLAGFRLQQDQLNAPFEHRKTMAEADIAEANKRLTGNAASLSDSTYNDQLAAAKADAESRVTAAEAAKVSLGDSKATSGDRRRAAKAGADSAEANAKVAGNEARMSDETYGNAVKAKTAEYEGVVVGLKQQRELLKKMVRDNKTGAARQAVAATMGELDTAIDQFTKLSGSLNGLYASDGTPLIPGMEQPLSQAFADVTNRMEGLGKRASELTGKSFNLDLKPSRKETGDPALSEPSEVDQLATQTAEEKAANAKRSEAKATAAEAAKASQKTWYYTDAEGYLRSTNDRAEAAALLSDPARRDHVLDAGKVDKSYLGRLYLDSENRPIRRDSPQGMLGGYASTALMMPGLFPKLRK